MIPKLMFFVIAGSFALTACVPGIFTPIFLETSGTLDASFPTLAIDRQGVKHLAWLEVTGTGTNIVYWQGWFGNPTFVVRHNDSTAYLPRIAVTDTGDAYIVWSQWTPGTVQYCYWKIPAEGSFSLNCSDLGADRNGKGIWVAARGEVVYVLYDSGNTLYYRQLAGGSAQGKASDIYDPDWFLPTNLRLVIDSNGKLHLLRMEQRGTTYSLHYNSNATVDSMGNMNQKMVIADTGGGPFDLAIANVGGSERVYIIRRGGTPPGHVIYYTHCVANGCSDPTGGQIPLEGTGWEIGEIRAAGTSTTLYVAWIARNSSTPGSDVQEVYLSTGLQKPSLIPETEFYPKRCLHLVTVGSPSVPVMGWRKAISGRSTDVYAAFPVLEGGFPVMKAQQIFTRFEPYIEPEGDALSANGEWVAGVWLYAQSPTNGRIVPWMAGNAYLVQMPVVIK